MLDERPTLAFLGVSLSNRTFSAMFARRLAGWVRGNCRLLTVLLGDECEAINYEVFRGLEPCDASALARRRADEIGRMFDRASRAENIPSRVLVESEWELLEHADFSECLDRLWRGYFRRGRFWTDVRLQVTTNLSWRARHFPEGYVSSRMDELVKYVIRELALFYTLRAQECGASTVELYPGRELFVKERLFAGRYMDEVSVRPLGYSPRFVNVGFLASPGAEVWGRRETGSRATLRDEESWEVGRGVSADFVLRRVV